MNWLDRVWNKSKEQHRDKLDVLIDDGEKGLMSSNELKSMAFRGQAKDFGDNWPIYSFEVKF